MARWLKDRGPIPVVAAAVVLLVGVAWLTVSVLVPWAVGSSWTDALGVPVTVARVRPVLFPLRLQATGVTLGEADDRTASAARVYVASNLGAWFGLPTERLDIEVWGPRVRAGAGAERMARSFVERLSAQDEDSSLEVSSLRVDEVTVDRGAEPAVHIAGFQLSDLRVDPSGEGGASATAELSVMSGTGRVVAEIARAAEGPTLLVGVDVDDVSLTILARVSELHLEGRARGRLWYEADWVAAESGSFGGSFTVEDLVVETAPRERVAMGRLEVDGLRVDPSGEVEIEALDADRVSLPPTALLGELGGAAPDGTVRIGAARIANVELDPAPRELPLRADLVVLGDLDTAAGTGTLELDGRLGDGTFRISGERLNPSRPGQGRFVSRSLPIAPLFAGRLGRVRVTEGVLDADLVLVAAPGLRGAGEIVVRSVAGEVEDLAEPRPLFEVSEVDLDVELVSLHPARLRLRQGRIVDPELWVRRGEDGFEVVAALRGDGSPDAPSFAERLDRRLGEALGESPVPRSAAPPAGVRLSGGEIHFQDQTVDPPFRMRVRKLEALVHGPAGVDGPLFFAAEGKGSLRSRFSIAAESSARSVTLTASADDASLSDFDAYVEHWTGHVARAGLLSLEARARFRPDPAALLGVRFQGVELAETGQPDLLQPILGAPLRELVGRLEAGGDGTGHLTLEIPGEADTPLYGFAQDFGAALRSAVDRALASPSEVRAPEAP